MLEDASEEAVASLGNMVPDGAGVQVAEIGWKKDTKIPVYLIAPAEGDRFVVADGDGSGSFEESEKSVLVATREGGALVAREKQTPPMLKVVEETLVGEEGTGREMLDEIARLGAQTMLVRSRLVSTRPETSAV